MALRRLTSLEAGKLQDEARSLDTAIDGFIKLLASPEALMQARRGPSSLRRLSRAP